jgi:hypothetical protein
MDKPDRAPIGESTQLAIRFSEDQVAAYEKAAKRAKQPLREWIRATLDREAGS